MNTELEMTVKARDVTGTASSRRLRHQGQVPGIIYGAGKDNEKILVAHEEIMHHLEIPAFYSSVISLRTPTGEQQVILREVQRHPYRPRVMHVDFQRIKASEKLHMKVPLHFEGGEEAPGVKIDAGILSFQITELDITCLPKDLPEYIAVDVSGLALNQSIHLSDIQLPEGVELTASALHAGDDPTLANVAPPKVMEEEEETLEEGLEVEGEEGAEGAPVVEGEPGAAPTDTDQKPSED